jgi:hypothetical protein
MIIKHKKFMDIAFLVTDKMAFKSYPGGYTLFMGEWLNLGFTKSWRLGEHQTIDITPDKAKDWLVCDSPDDECLRFSQWSPLIL